MSSGSGEVPNVDPTTAWEKSTEEDAVILDVREPDELQQVAIRGAMHIPLGQLQNRLNDVPQDRDVYVLCHVGQRSAMATEFLRATGHPRVWNIQGGVLAWLQRRLPADWGDQR